MTEVPKGWPVRCLNCESWSFNFTTDRTGNARVYTCGKCGKMYVAVWKGAPLSNCLSEPKNTLMENWEWSELEPPEFLDLDIKTEVVIIGKLGNEGQEDGND